MSVYYLIVLAKTSITILSKQGGIAPLSHFRGNALSLCLFSEMLPMAYIILRCVVSIPNVIHDFGFLLLDHSHHLLKQNCMSSFPQWFMRPTSLNKNRTTSGESIGLFEFGPVFPNANYTMTPAPLPLQINNKMTFLCQKRSRENSIPCGMLSLEPSFSVFLLKTLIHKMSPVDTSDRPVDTSCPYGQPRCSSNWSCFFSKQNITSTCLETSQ